jgi:hypothetical protein
VSVSSRVVPKGHTLLLSVTVQRHCPPYLQNVCFARNTRSRHVTVVPLKHWQVLLGTLAFWKLISEVRRYIWQNLSPLSGKFGCISSFYSLKFTVQSKSSEVLLKLCVNNNCKKAESECTWSFSCWHIYTVTLTVSNERVGLTWKLNYRFRVEASCSGGTPSVSWPNYGLFCLRFIVDFTSRCSWLPV